MKKIINYWKKGKKEKCIILIAVLFLIGFFTPNEDNKVEEQKEPVSIETNNNVSTDDKIEEVVEVEPTTYEEMIKYILKDDYLEHNIGNVSDDKKELTIYYHQEMGLTLNSTKREIQDTSCLLYQKLFNLIPEDVDAICVVAKTETTNKYGEVGLSNISILTLERDTFNRIVWDNFNKDNIWDMYEHNYLHKDLQ